jgi:hypothetical protein
VSTYLVVGAEENAVVEDGVEEAGGCGADENRDVLERFYHGWTNFCGLELRVSSSSMNVQQWKIIWKTYYLQINEREYIRDLVDENGILWCSRSRVGWKSCSVYERVHCELWILCDLNEHPFLLRAA